VIMSDPAKPPTLFSEAIREELQEIVKQAVSEAMKSTKNVEERLLDAEEAARVLSATKEWLYQNRRRLPFTRKLGHKLLRFSYAGMLRWIESKKFGP